MRILIATFLLASFTANGQTDCRRAVVADSTDFEIASLFPLTGVAGNYFHSFSEMKQAGSRPVSDEAKTAIPLNDRELRELLVVVADLAIESRALLEQARLIVFEVRLEMARDSEIASGVATALSLLEEQWNQMVMAHANQLKDSVRPQVSRSLDEFVKSGKSIYISDVHNPTSSAK